MAEKARGKKILLVEDDEPLREMFSAVLSKVGYSVDPAKHGLEAIQKLKLTSYDLILTDMNMPYVDGIDLYLNSIEKHPHMKGRFLFMSGHFPLEVLENRSLIVKKFLVKPFKPKDLVQFVDSILAETAKGGAEMRA
ncbi:MAG: response regulator [Deltaproteobacteria bacterium]|nr:response regulator [Deltaproteobacteria bacterium]